MKRRGWARPEGGGYSAENAPHLPPAPVGGTGQTASPIRCSAPHPDDPRRICRARLLDAVPETVDVRTESNPPPGCVSVKCPRQGCGAVYVVCARNAA